MKLNLDDLEAFEAGILDAGSRQRNPEAAAAVLVGIHILCELRDLRAQVDKLTATQTEGR